MNIVTKSGTNRPQGSWFDALPRHDDEREDGDREAERRRQAGLPPQPVRRLFGGPIVKDKAHFFAALRADAAGHVPGRATPRGSSPTRTASSRRRTARTCSPCKGTANMNASQYLSVRYGRNTNCAALRREPAVAAEQLGQQRQQVQLVQRQPQLGARRLEAERVHLPVRRLRQRDQREQPRSATSRFPNGVTIGQNTNTPQQTQQKK